MIGRDWQKVSGKVVRRRMTGAVAMQYGNNFRYEYDVDLQQPDPAKGGPPRRVTIQDPRIKTFNWNAPEVGEVIALKVHPDGRVVFDKRDPRRSVPKFKRLHKKGLV